MGRHSRSCVRTQTLFQTPSATPKTPSTTNAAQHHPKTRARHHRQQQQGQSDGGGAAAAAGRAVKVKQQRRRYLAYDLMLVGGEGVMDLKFGVRAGGIQRAA